VFAAMSESEPDGFIVLHRNPDGRPVYGIGPFPPDERLAEVLVKQGSCDCEREIVYVRFPAGIKLLVGVDLTEIVEAITEIAGEQRAADRDLMN
jgi:hypothetical protein